VPAVDRRAEVEAFNRATVEATTRMDNEALLALWDDDGVTLLPGSEALVGKPAIRAMLQKVTAELAGARMRSFEMHCHGLEISGDVATEYCDEHQVVDLPGGKPPFDGKGKVLYVLRRGDGGVWRLLREMWNSSGS
jgi:ketosteroid isomerase-like protein